MAVIVFIAADFATLRAILPRIPNPGLVIMILVLEVGLFRMVSQRRAARTFWLGFEVAGWAYVVTCGVFAWTAWRLARSIFEAYILRGPIGSPFQMQRFILFAGSLQLLVSLAVALIVGILTRSAWSRWIVVCRGYSWRIGSGRSRPEDRVGHPDHPWRTIAGV
jgi:hypothetical protein